MGRKSAKREALDGELVELRPGEKVVRVAALRGSNQLEVEDENGTKMLCRMPARFSKSIWIRRGSYVIVEEADREKVLEANGKITGTLSRVLYADQVQKLEKTSYWPAGFRAPESLAGTKERVEQRSSDDEDELPIEGNMNRQGGRDSQGEETEDSSEDER